jgi:ectoine hydroxylase-related dioxygenase (phytanoyl-CoA dioxygenase family)
MSIFSTSYSEIYAKNGYIIFDDYISSSEINLLNKTVNVVSHENLPGIVREDDGKKIRSINGAHMHNVTLKRLCRLPRLIMPAMTLLKNQVYVHQFKINFKSAFEGDVWEWHQDYIFWLKEDGMPKPNVLTVVIFLDDITEFNAPMFLIPGSHKYGTIDVEAKTNSNLSKATPAWLNNTTAQLKYGANKDIIKKIALDNGLFSAKGKAGTVLYFDGNLFHASSSNISPFDRKIILITYNATDNALQEVSNQRPSFLANRDFSPLVPLSEDEL